jgi:hypothetical protein
MRILSGIAVGAALLTACATEPAPATTNATEQAAKPIALADASSDKKICRRMPVMGSNMAKKVCSTAEEWAAFDSKGRRDVEEFDRQRGVNGTATSGERLQ